MIPGQSPALTEKLQENIELLKHIDDCVKNPPTWWGSREERLRFLDCISKGSQYNDPF